MKWVLLNALQIKFYSCIMEKSAKRVRHRRFLKTLKALNVRNSWEHYAQQADSSFIPYLPCLELHQSLPGSDAAAQMRPLSDSVEHQITSACVVQNLEKT